MSPCHISKVWEPNQNETMREISSPGKVNKKFGVESWNPLLRLSKSGFYVKSLKVGGIVDHKIRSWIVRPYIFSYLKQKHINNDFVC